MTQVTIQFNDTKLIKQYVDRGKLLDPEKERLRAIERFGFRKYAEELRERLNCSNTAISMALNGRKPARLALIHDLLNSLENSDNIISKNSSEPLGINDNLTQNNPKS